MINLLHFIIINYQLSIVNCIEVVTDNIPVARVRLTKTAQRFTFQRMYLFMKLRIAF